MSNWPVGEWSASQRLLDESRAESLLQLGADGRYADTLRWFPAGQERVIRGAWRYDAAAQRFQFEPDADHELGAPLVALGLAALRLPAQPSGELGRATDWARTGDPRVDDFLGLACLNPPVPGALELRYGPYAPPLLHAPLTHWRDPVWGELVWDRTQWFGWLAFGGRQVRVCFCSFEDDWEEDAEQQCAILARWQHAAAQLIAAEPALRRAACAQLSAALAASGNAVSASQAEFEDSLSLLLVRFQDEEGELRYVSPGVWGAQPISIFFAPDLSLREVQA